MTVSNLWKVLDEAGCGVAVGIFDILDPSHQKKLANPWTSNKLQQLPRKSTTLAVDLSIWICEGLTSTAMASTHSSPALHLAYTRSMKLLNAGIKLIIVVEGKRRVRRAEEADRFQRRRSGTAFWKACRDCEEMFNYMGVPTVRAKAEGEALCALLNARGIVDGVISNDGDCLLFGAKVVYTKFSIENLQNSQVICYESSNLKALVDQEESDINQDVVEDGKIRLSRFDLVSFALLTGSDLAGNGFPKVGYKKAVRFLCKCKFDYPLNTEKAAIDELRSWAKTATIVHSNSTLAKDEKGRCCSICHHPGDKRSHMKNGCIICGTKPGEPCFPFTSSDMFRQNLRQKALTLDPKFEPAMVVDAYLAPNCNQIPLQVELISSQHIEMETPKIKEFLESSLIIKGQNISSSREYVAESLSKLLVRKDLFGERGANKGGHYNARRSLSNESPIPIEIKRCLVRDQIQCFEISWKVNATVTDSEGNDIDGYEFSTIEAQDLIKNRYPDLVVTFQAMEKEKQKQGDTEKVKRREFLEKILNLGTSEHKKDVDQLAKKGRKQKRVQEKFFNSQRAKRTKRRVSTTFIKDSDEIKAMMQTYDGKDRIEEDFDFSTLASGSLVFHLGKKKKQYGKAKERMYSIEPVGMTITVIQQNTGRDEANNQKKSFEQLLVQNQAVTMIAPDKFESSKTNLQLTSSVKMQSMENFNIDSKKKACKEDTASTFNYVFEDQLQNKKSKKKIKNDSLTHTHLQKKVKRLENVDAQFKKDKVSLNSMSQEDIPLMKWFQEVGKDGVCCKEADNSQMPCCQKHDTQDEGEQQNNLRIERERNESTSQQRASLKSKAFHIEKNQKNDVEVSISILHKEKDEYTFLEHEGKATNSLSRLRANTCNESQHDNGIISYRNHSYTEKSKATSVLRELKLPKGEAKALPRNRSRACSEISCRADVESYVSKLIDDEKLKTFTIRDEKIYAPCTPRKEVSSPFDPTAWIEQVIIDASNMEYITNTEIRCHRPNRRLETDFNHRMSVKEPCNWPSLAADLKNVVVCDMGMMIQVTPVKSRYCKRNSGDIAF